MSGYELAKRLHVPPPRVNDILLEKRGISAGTAIRLARLFGTTTEFWMNLQTSYEIRRAEAAAGKQLSRIEPMKSGSAA